MATKDWKKVRTYEYMNKKKKIVISMVINQDWDGRKDYSILIENKYTGKDRYYDNHLTTKKEVLQSMKAYMRKH